MSIKLTGDLPATGTFTLERLAKGWLAPHYPLVERRLVEDFLEVCRRTPSAALRLAMAGGDRRAFFDEMNAYIDFHGPYAYACQCDASTVDGAIGAGRGHAKGTYGE